MSTIDIVTNVVSGNLNIKNGTAVVFCMPTANYKTLDATFEQSITYDNLESLYTDRFENNIDSFRIVDGGAP